MQQIYWNSVKKEGFYRKTADFFHKCSARPSSLKITRPSSLQRVQPSAHASLSICPSLWMSLVSAEMEMVGLVVLERISAIAEIAALLRISFFLRSSSSPFGCSCLSKAERNYNNFSCSILCWISLRFVVGGWYKNPYPLRYLTQDNWNDGPDLLSARAYLG